jgi:hypothetical protein
MKKHGLSQMFRRRSAQSGNRGRYCDSVAVRSGAAVSGGATVV